ncbi:hypothetical protein SK128_015487 [Halocaridina rubra]|uniref:Uncharacterized protein n=1 Tax=Halocaridina rubra TaxID=373956 RepID=A0AAN8XJK4_HALRR
MGIDWIDYGLVVDPIWLVPTRSVSWSQGQIAPCKALMFRKQNPDGGKFQNCLLVRPNGLYDTECKKSSCSACHTTAGNTWTLRGICEEEEQMYYFDVVREPLAFRGYGEYLVEKMDNAWVWFNTVTNTTKATIQTGYPIGRMEWDVKISRVSSGTES